MSPDTPAALHRVELTTPPGPGMFIADADDVTREPDQVADAMRDWLNQRDHRGVRLTSRFVDGRDVTIEWSAPQPTAANLTAVLRNTRPAIEALEGNQFTAWRRKLGLFGLYAAKEVGPPPWPIPKVGLWLNRRRVHALVGWRSTAYHASMTPTPAVAAVVLAVGLTVAAGVRARKRIR